MTKKQRKYQVTLTETQLDAVQRGLEFYSRIAMGQFREISDKWMYGFDWPHEQTDYERETLHRLGHKFVDLPPNAYRGIAQCPDVVCTAHDVYQVIRHRLSWDHEPKGGHTVNFNEPLKCGPQPLCKIRLQPFGRPKRVDKKVKK